MDGTQSRNSNPDEYTIIECRILRRQARAMCHRCKVYVTLTSIEFHSDNDADMLCRTNDRQLQDDKK